MLNLIVWNVLNVPLGTSIGIVSRITTLEENVASSGSKIVSPQSCTSRSVLALLQEVGVLH